jgi:hypothetical protein
MRPQQARWFDNSNPASKWATAGQVTITFGEELDAALLPGLYGLWSITPWKVLNPRKSP